jgi:cytidylate kinase
LLIFIHLQKYCHYEGEGVVDETKFTVGSLNNQIPIEFKFAAWIQAACDEFDLFRTAAVQLKINRLSSRSHSG